MGGGGGESHGKHWDEAGKEQEPLLVVELQVHAIVDLIWRMELRKKKRRGGASSLKFPPPPPK